MESRQNKMMELKECIVKMTQNIFLKIGNNDFDQLDVIMSHRLDLLKELTAVAVTPEDRTELKKFFLEIDAENQKITHLLLEEAKLVTIGLGNLNKMLVYNQHRR